MRMTSQKGYGKFGISLGSCPPEHRDGFILSKLAGFAQGALPKAVHLVHRRSSGQQQLNHRDVASGARQHQSAALVVVVGVRWETLLQHLQTAKQRKAYAARPCNWRGSFRSRAICFLHSCSHAMLVRITKLRGLKA